MGCVGSTEGATPRKLSDYATERAYTEKRYRAFVDVTQGRRHAHQTNTTSLFSCGASCPHGGSSAGVGPIGVVAHLAPFLPGHPAKDDGAVSAAPFSSAGILPITYMHILRMGTPGLTRTTATAILSANFITTQLGDEYKVLYSGRNDRVTHGCIIDIRPIEAAHGISNEDIAKRLIDFGFHAPTMSFPVASTLMIEPTESESLAEIDRFCNAMLAIAAEIKKVGDGI